MAIEVQSILKIENVLLDVPARCKRDALGLLSTHAAETFGLDQKPLLDRLYEREKLGTTGIGNGVALPHARTELSELHAVLAILKHPIDFDAVDDRPVDLLFMLLAPERADAEHLKALSRVARLLREQPVRAAMRGAKDREALFAVATASGNAVAA